MADDNKKNNDNHYLIGSKPETIKADIMIFKEEVLVDFKDLGKKLDQKYNKINNELRENMELFDEKISNLESKILELNSKIVTDTITREKLSQLLNFKEKAEIKMEINKNKIRMINNETYNKINEIDNLLRFSFFIPGLIGPKYKYKTFREFIEYISSQVNSLNSFKEKALIELGLYKTKLEYLFNSLKIKIDNAEKEIKYSCMENIKKNEEKFLEEMSLRDEKFKSIRVENQEYIYKLDKQMNNLNTEMKTIKVVEEEMNNKIKGLEAENGDKYNNIIEKYNYIENKMFNLNNSLEKAVSYLNRQGANIKIIKDNENNKNTNYQNLFFNENIFTKNKNTEKRIKNNSDNYRNNETSYEYETKELFNKKIKSSKERESDISKYIKGELTAAQIGLSTNRHRKEMITVKSQYEEHLIDKQEYQKKYLTNKPKNDIKKENNLIKKINNNEELFNDDLYVKYTNSVENTRDLKKRKKFIKSFSGFKNLTQIGFQDLALKFRYDILPANENKSSRNIGNNRFYKFNKDNNYFFYKNGFDKMNYTKIHQPKSTKNIERKLNKKNFNIIPGNKMITLKNLEKELTAINFFNKNKKEPNLNLLSPIIQKIDKDKKKFEKNNTLIRLDNNLQLPKLSLAKIKKKIINFRFDSKRNNKVESNSNNTFNSDRIEYTK